MTQSLPLSPRPLSSPSASAQAALTLLGPSAAMSHLWTQLRRLAPHVRTVLLTGEPDCGQEAIARVLLDLSPQTHRSFVQLSASEIEGRLLRPSGPVSFPTDIHLYLPDVHLLSAAAQDALLRLLRMRRARSFTVVAAAAEDLRGLVGTGRFSPELADLLTGVTLAVPALRERAEDLPMLLNHMLATQAEGDTRSLPQPTEDFLRAAMQHTWPGNLRELAQVLKALSSGKARGPLQSVDLYGALAACQHTRKPQTSTTRLVSLDTVVQEHIRSVLRACRGNKLRAAEVLGISRSTLYRMLDVTENAPVPAPTNLTTLAPQPVSLSMAS